LTHNPLSVPALVGVIMLIGIAVNNGIVLIDFANQLQRDGVPLEEALILAGRTRLRPILMTALTTVIGMVPMALSHGQGSEIEIPLAIGVICGLSLATVLTLFVVPAVYLLLYRSRRPASGAGVALLLLVVAGAVAHPPHSAAAAARFDLNLAASGASAPVLSYAARLQDDWGVLAPRLMVEAAPDARQLGVGAGATLTLGPASPWSIDAAWAERVYADAGAGDRFAARIGWSRPGDAASVAMGRQDTRYSAGDDLFDRLADPSGGATLPTRWLVAQADHRTPAQTTWRITTTATPRAQDLLVGPSLQWGRGNFHAGVGAVRDAAGWEATFALEYGFSLRNLQLQLGATGPGAFQGGYRSYLGLASSRLRTDLVAWWSRPATAPVWSAVVSASAGSRLSWRLAYQSGAGVEAGIGLKL
ncbi:MAG TPA: efflux RND transporter permease subunit, partial [Limnochordia bacterium]|nr:efflux RND transporter permease subunit [Limnochordia bacterium]